jgi:hypothetical protein
MRGCPLCATAVGLADAVAIARAVPVIVRSVLIEAKAPAPAWATLDVFAVRVVEPCAVASAPAAPAVCRTVLVAA